MKKNQALRVLAAPVSSNDPTAVARRAKAWLAVDTLLRSLVKKAVIHHAVWLDSEIDDMILELVVRYTRQGELQGKRVASDEDPIAAAEKWGRWHLPFDELCALAPGCSARELKAAWKKGTCRGVGRDLKTELRNRSIDVARQLRKEGDPRFAWAHEVADPDPKKPEDWVYRAEGPRRFVEAMHGGAEQVQPTEAATEDSEGEVRRFVVARADEVITMNKRKTRQITDFKTYDRFVAAHSLEARSTVATELAGTRTHTAWSRSARYGRTAVLDNIDGLAAAQVTRLADYTDAIRALTGDGQVVLVLVPRLLAWVEEPWPEDDYAALDIPLAELIAFRSDDLPPTWREEPWWEALVTLAFCTLAVEHVKLFFTARVR